VLSPGLGGDLVASCDAIEREVQLGDPRRMPAAVARVHALLAEFALRDQARRHDQDFTALACARLSQALDQALDLAQLARGFDLGVEAFRKAFTAATGVPPARYRQARRIERARVLLATTGEPLAAIAAALGYCDQYFFSRQFTQATGVSPARYRREFGGSSARAPAGAGRGGSALPVPAALTDQGGHEAAP
jgi:transcriptional regulator GlxA family with amidase domain